MALKLEQIQTTEQSSEKAGNAEGEGVKVKTWGTPWALGSGGQD